MKYSLVALATYVWIVYGDTPLGWWYNPRDEVTCVKGTLVVSPGGEVQLVGVQSVSIRPVPNLDKFTTGWDILLCGAI